MNKDLILGKDETKRVVSVELNGNNIHLFKETNDGIEEEIRPAVNPYWILQSENVSGKLGRLKGDLHYKYFNNLQRQDYYDELQRMYRCRHDFFTIRDNSQRVMVKEGIGLFGDIKVSEVSVLSFDIETNGLALNNKSKVLMITNTYKKDGQTIRKLYTEDKFNSQKEMINAWCGWIREINPTILTGHNIFGFDFGYLRHCGGELFLGRDKSAAKFAQRSSVFRKDGSQGYDYKDIKIFGRQIVDTMFLAIKHDIGRKYPSYGLKQIIKFEGLESEDREFYPASEIGDNWVLPEERAKIIKYGEQDSDDAMALYELMIPSFFYYNRSIPMSLQMVINRASGSQLNSMMIRGYLQQKHSIPKAEEKVHFKGGLSDSNPGLYENVYKVDVASQYPSIMLQYRLSPKEKDPLNLYLDILDTFTTERLKEKKIANDTGNRYYRDLEQSKKIIINSAYGLLGAPGLNFNKMKVASRITLIGRSILQRGINFALKKGYKIVNIDTDAFSFVGLKENFNSFISKLNSLYKEKILFEDDGFYDKVLVVKTKNYALLEKGELIIKGSSLKASMKEPMLKSFINDTINLYIREGKDGLVNNYNKYAKLIPNIEDISEWSSKKTVTKAVLHPDRTQEKRILEAIGKKRVQEGDKVFMFFKSKDELCLTENFNGEYNQDRLYEKLFKSIKIFETVVDIKDFKNYKLKKNIELRP